MPNEPCVFDNTTIQKYLSISNSSARRLNSKNAIGR